MGEILFDSMASGAGPRTRVQEWRRCVHCRKRKMIESFPMSNGKRMNTCRTCRRMQRAFTKKDTPFYLR